MALSTSGTKRRRLTSPFQVTPSDSDRENAVSTMGSNVSSVDTALHVFSTELSALANLKKIYASDNFARTNMENSVQQIVETVRAGGKLVVSGVGKSGLIGKKVSATMNSLGVHSAFLHPTEALHGDLGMVRQNDTILLISFSGKTSELMLLIPHLPSTVTIITLTAHTEPSICPLLTAASRDKAILLPAVIHEPEEISFGVSAPMASTTVALAIGDALALATARSLHTLPGNGPADVFRELHPGGAIGATFASASVTPPLHPSPSTFGSRNHPPGRSNGAISGPDLPRGRTIHSLMTPISAIPVITTSLSPSSHSTLRIDDIMRAAISYPSAKSWVRTSETQIISPRRVRTLSRIPDLSCQINDLENASEIIIIKEWWIRIPSSTSLDSARFALSHDSSHQNQTNGAHTRSQHHKRDADGKIRLAEARVIAVTDASDDILGFVEEDAIWVDHGCHNGDSTP